MHDFPAGGRRLAPLLALALAATVFSAAPARAEVRPQVANPVRISVTSAANSFAKSVVVNCPAGQRVYGAGGEITGGVGNVTLDDISPNMLLTNVTVTAFEIGAFAGNWSLTGYAICGPSTLNLQRIEFTSATNSVSKSVFAGCPSGLRLYGLGAEISGAPGSAIFDDLTPNAALTGVTVTAFEIGAFAGNWSLTGYAICGNPSSTMVRAVATSASNSLAVKSATATCPAGTRAHGVGGELNGSFGAVVLDDLRPNLNLPSALVTGDETGAFAGNWSVTSYAICAS